MSDARRVRDSGCFVEMREVVSLNGKHRYEIELFVYGQKRLALGSSATEVEREAAKLLRSRRTPEPYHEDVHGPADPSQWQDGHR